MKNVEYAIAYREVFEILKYVPKADYDKIPSEKIELYKTMQDKNYNFKYDPSKTLDEQNVSRRAKAIIGLLFRDYWATETQRQKILSKQKYERQKIEEKKKEKYNTNELFKNKRTIKTIEEQDIKKESMVMILPKENFFKKFIKKIKNIFMKS